MEKFTPNDSKGCPFCNAGEKEIDYKDGKVTKGDKEIKAELEEKRAARAFEKGLLSRLKSAKEVKPPKRDNTAGL